MWMAAGAGQAFLGKELQKEKVTRKASAQSEVGGLYRQYSCHRMIM